MAAVVQFPQSLKDLWESASSGTENFLASILPKQTALKEHPQKVTEELLKFIHNTQSNPK